MPICTKLDDNALQAAAGKVAGRIARAMGFEAATASEETDDAQVRLHSELS